MIIYHGANKQNQNLNKAKINLLYMINYRFLNTLYYLPLTKKIIRWLGKSGTFYIDVERYLIYIKNS